MNNVADIRARRLIYLKAVYDRTSANTFVDLPEEALGTELGFSPETTNGVVEFLVNEGLLSNETFGTVSITHLGVRDVEEALSQPDRPTRYFPPVVNVLSIHNMISSQVQQGTHESTQTGSFGALDEKSLAEFLQAVKTRLPDLALTPDQTREVAAQTATVEAQLGSPRPKLAIIRESLHTVRNVLEGCAGHLAAGVLLEHLSQILAMLPS